MKITILKIKFFNQFVYPVLIQKNNINLLIDTGYKDGYEDLIKELKQKANITPQQITHILLTHEDYDHIYNAFYLKKENPNIKIISSQIAAPYISGEKKFLRLIQVENNLNNLDQKEKEIAINLINAIKETNPIEVDIKVKDQQTLNFIDLDEIQIIYTQGHIDGHISLYIPSKSIVITGDASLSDGKKLILANAKYALDFQEAKRSLEKILSLDAKEYIVYHNGLIKIK